jgi:hypothetical protein
VKLVLDHEPLTLNGSSWFAIRGGMYGHTYSLFEQPLDLGKSQRANNIETDFSGKTG